MFLRSADAYALKEKLVKRKIRLLVRTYPIIYNQEVLILRRLC